MNARRIPVVTPKERVAKTATLPTLVDALGSMTDYSATVSYDVTLPMANDDVVYRLQLASSAAKADPLSDVTYLIDWTLERDEADSKGFLAYFNGHHYRFRDHRLQEYHYEWDSIPFITKPGGHFVCVIPGDAEVDLKKAAKAAGAKKAEMIPMKELLPLTGYIRGGCCPIGMKKPFPTFFHSTALLYPEIYVSAGVRGMQLCINPQALISYVGAEVTDLIHTTKEDDLDS